MPCYYCLSNKNCLALHCAARVNKSSVCCGKGLSTHLCNSQCRHFQNKAPELYLSKRITLNAAGTFQNGRSPAAAVCEHAVFENAALISFCVMGIVFISHKSNPVFLLFCWLWMLNMLFSINLETLMSQLRLETRFHWTVRWQSGYLAVRRKRAVSRAAGFNLWLQFNFYLLLEENLMLNGLLAS